MYKVIALTLCLTGVVIAGGYTLAPDGSYVGGNRAILTPNGTYVGDNK